MSVKHRANADTHGERGAWLRDTFFRWMLLATIAGTLIGLWSVSASKVLTAENGVLLAAGSSAVALLAVILAAIALMTTFLQGRYGDILGAASDVAEFLRPFKIVARISAAA